MRYNKSNNAGFTLIEAIAVLLILVIISAVAISRSGSNESNLRAELNNLKAAMRYTQQMAIASDSTMTYTITVTNSGYTLSKNAVVVILPGEASGTHTFDGVTASTGGVFTFNEWGGLATGSATTTILQLSGGGSSKTINVLVETGYADEL